MRCFISIPGEPEGKGRPRGTRSGHFYTPEKTRLYEVKVRSEYQRQSGGMYFENPVKITVVAGYKIPESVSKRRKAELLDGAAMPEKKPDWDNIGKVICDALNGIAYPDDKIVVDGQVKKFWRIVPTVVVMISDEVRRQTMDEYLAELGYIQNLDL